MDLNTTGIDSTTWKSLWYAANNNYDMIHYLDSMSPNQTESKIWLVEKISLILSQQKNLKIQLYGGWFGYPLCKLLYDTLNISFVENIDLDEQAIKIFKIYSESHSHNNIATVDDVRNSNSRDTDIDLVINSSSEHMPNLPELLKNKSYRKKNQYKSKPDACLFALQSNNMFHVEDHINCVNNEDELAKKSGLSNIMYKGCLNMSNGYKRFMVIGYV